MKTMKDARYLINRKQLKRPTNMIRKAPRGVMDARSILNSKHKSRPMNRAGVNVQGSFSSTKRSIPSNASTSQVAPPEKRVKVARDGNIVITAKSKEVFPHSVPRWSPADVETTNVENLGIDDVLDMDSLPSTLIGMNKALPSNRSLAEEIVDMQDTMIADQVSTLQQQPSMCVYVSNLHASVSKQDIVELFGDIGLIKRVEMTQPGVALVEFFDSNDAIKACELYHQRLLDGQPMMCQVQPSKRSSLISQRLGERVDPRPSLVNSRSIHNPQNVRFTVKLS
ncbi:polymerase delta-interacting protein 3 [Parasteatoda tepidariorum]|nr:polymerase delta-interacting protein 3 [Parasteatoda tepidariorum]